MVAQPASAPEAKPRLASHRHRKRGLPVTWVFYVSAALALLSIALIYLLGRTWLFAPALTCVLLTYVLYRNDRKGFGWVRKKQGLSGFGARTSRRNFLNYEMMGLLGLLLANILVSVYVLIA